MDLETFRLQNLQNGLNSRLSFFYRKSDTRQKKLEPFKFQPDTLVRLAANAVTASPYESDRGDVKTLQRGTRLGRQPRALNG